MSGHSDYRFLPWVRSGAATAITDRDGGRDDQPAHADVPVSLTAGDSPVRMPVRLYGPGDVAGLARSQVLRTEPEHGAQDFEPNYFPAVELRRPDLPWLFTPARAGTSSRLRPWLCLVVILQQDGVRLRPDDQRGVSVLEIAPPARPAAELPDLAEVWAWAHAQVTGDADADPADLLATGGRRAIARLLCPRRLQPGLRYLACLVPTFEVGRRAGLGEPTGNLDTLTPAWRLDPPPDRVRLPVFHHWQFQTGPRGDFESLLRQLTPRAHLTGVGTVPVVLTGAHPALPPLPPEAPGAVLDLAGALRPPGTAPRPWPAEPRDEFAQALTALLDAPHHALRDGAEDPVVAPPLYGRWHAAESTVSGADPQGWFRQLNLDPRHRATAGAGAAVVGRFQEPLMASAWRQVGDVNRANQLLRQAQLARCVGEALIRKHLRGLPTDALLRVTAPSHGRVRAADGIRPAGAAAPEAQVLASRLAASPVPPAALSAPYRRISRPRGPLARRVGRTPRPAGRHRLAAPVVALNRGETQVVAPARAPSGLVSVDAVSEALGGGEAVRFDALAAAAVDDAPARPDFDVGGATPAGDGPDAGGETGDNEVASRFRDAAGDQQASLFAEPTAPVAPAVPLELATLRDALLEALAPDTTVPARVLSRIHRPGPDGATPGPRGGGTDDDPVAPVLAAPSFPQPMYAALRDVSPDLLLPGLAHVPPDTVTLLEANPGFIAAYLVGLNHEMSRELLWREYPTDQRGTMFRHFWDETDPDAGAPAGRAAIEPIHTWPAGRALADVLIADQPPLVLLIRGQLLRRYPDTLIYAVKARWADGGARRVPDEEAGERHPQFRGTLDRDTTFVGFRHLTAAQARGSTEPGPDAGWFLAVAQQPTAPRFGLDVASAFPPEPRRPRRWSELSWAHLAPDRDALRELTHVRLGGDLPDTSEVDDPSGAEWGTNAAHLAAITLQQPVRVLIHAADMLPDPAAEPGDD